MSENKVETKIQQIGNVVEKALSEQTSRVESAVTELTKLQSKGVEQVTTLIERANHVAQEQIAFAEQIGAEWRKLALAATRSYTGIFAPKA